MIIRTTLKFENEVIDCIMQYNPEAEIADETEIACKMVHVRDKRLTFCLLPIPFAGLESVNPVFFQERSLEYAEQGVQVIHLWQDCWVAKKEIVRSRIAALSGSCIRIHARQTEVRRIARDVASSFFAVNHLQSFVRGRYHYGLYFDDHLVAAATFSAGRNITRNGVVCRSFELLRYANLLHHRVTGGLGKLLARFVKEVNPDDVMTYADLDWASGKGYRALNFQQIMVTPPQTFWIHPAEMKRYYPHLLPPQLTDEFQRQSQYANMDDFLKDKGYVSIYNAGNLKFLRLFPTNTTGVISKKAVQK